MRLSGAEIVVRALEDEGVRFCFGIPGTHNIELYDALASSDQVRALLVTDEQSAGFMADGVWRASGQLACANLVPGAGLTHALSGIAEAYLDGVPLLVLGCGIRQDSGRAFQLHDVDQLAMARPVTKAAVRVTEGKGLYRAIRSACAIARSGTPGPVMVEVPVDLYLFQHAVDDADLQAEPAEEPPHPSAEQVRRAAILLSERGARPLLYVGLGAAGAGADLVTLAERLGAPVATTISGKGVFPESHPLFLWNGFGPAAPPFARRVAGDCTVTLAIGCRFSEVGTGSYGCEPRGPLIHVDVNPAVLHRNYRATLGIVADAAAFVRALLHALPDAVGAGRVPPLQQAIRAGHQAVRRERLEQRSPERVTPAVLLEAVQRRFGPDTIYATDSGNGTFLAMECLRLEHAGCFLAPVDYSCMGYAVPAALGAKLARPDAPVVALAGDGAFLMTGLELLTAASQEIPLAVFLLRDGELAQIAQLQEAAFNRKSATVLPDYHAGSLAESLGVEWLALERDQEIDEVLERVGGIVGLGRPVLVDTAIDYEQKTWFTRGIVKTNLARLPWRDRLRFVARAMGRRIS